MTDIVERLERLATWGGNATHLDYEGAILDAKAEIERLRGAEQDAAEWVDERTKRLRADNARLRAALRAVVDFEASPDFTKWAKVIENASKALEGKDD